MGGGPHTQVDADDAISEISPESIDAIAAEAKHQNPYEQTPEIYTNTTTKGKEAFSADAPSRTTFRRTKVQNTSLAIHFSHPRAPLETASASGQNIRVGSKSDSKSPSSKEAKLSKEDDWTPPPREPWMIHKEALKQKFPRRMEHTYWQTIISRCPGRNSCSSRPDARVIYHQGTRRKLQGIT